jgi:6-phosphogluconolactonase
MAMDLFGRFLYVTGFYIEGVSAYRIGENGALTPVVGSPFPAGGVSGSIVVDPLGRFVYLADFDDSGKGSLSAYRISGNGALKAVPGSPFQIELGYLTVDPSGRFLYGTNGGGISAYRIGGNGALTPVFGSPFQTGFSPYFMAVGP